MTEIFYQVTVALILVKLKSIRFVLELVQIHALFVEMLSKMVQKHVMTEVFPQETDVQINAKSS